MTNLPYLKVPASRTHGRKRQSLRNFRCPQDTTFGADFWFTTGGCWAAAPQPAGWFPCGKLLSWPL